MLPPNADTPEIIVVTLEIDPRKGSEPGKGWWWSNALSPFFKLHIITQPVSVEACLPEPTVREAGWEFHPTTSAVTTWKFPTGYRQYAAWLQEALQMSATIAKDRPIAGLCHVTLGSFRVLPPYESLGIPFVIGPLGGGECAPMAHLWPRPVPFTHKLTESIRPLFNNLFAIVPALRQTLRHAAMVMTTSRETEQVVRRMGARHTTVVFPDAYDQKIDLVSVIRRREAQLSEIGHEVRLLWQGRPLWWKGPDIALLLVARAVAAGIRIRLTMVCPWQGEFSTRIKELIQRLGIASQVELREPASREVFIQTFEEHHGFLATSLHDSGGIPLLEAQAAGLPCLTLALGGNRLAACPEAGLGAETPNTDAFLHRAVECLRQWQQDPAAWLQDVRAAGHFAQQFTNARLQDNVRDFIAPAFSAPSS